MLLMSFGAFVVIAVAPLMMRSCFCFRRLRLASQLRLRAVLALPALLSIPSALANGLPRLQQADCDACRLTVPLALANGLPRLQLVSRDACRLQKDTAAGQHRFQRKWRTVSNFRFILKQYSGHACAARPWPSTPTLVGPVVA